MDQSEWTDQIAVGYPTIYNIEFCNLIAPLGVDPYDAISNRLLHHALVLYCMLIQLLP